jgi:hypothetical protein
VLLEVNSALTSFITQQAVQQVTTKTIQTFFYTGLVRRGCSWEVFCDVWVGGLLQPGVAAAAGHAVFVAAALLVLTISSKPGGSGLPPVCSNPCTTAPASLWTAVVPIHTHIPCVHARIPPAYRRWVPWHCPWRSPRPSEWALGASGVWHCGAHRWLASCWQPPSCRWGVCVCGRGVDSPWYLKSTCFSCLLFPARLPACLPAWACGGDHEFSACCPAALHTPTRHFRASMVTAR